MTFKDKVGLVSTKFRQIVSQKYNIIEMKLFGSFVRGDYSNSSDIAYDLELEYDCLIDVTVVPENVKNNIPLCQTIEKEGIPI